MKAVEKIETYISSHAHVDNPEVWEFVLIPRLTEMINNLNQIETNDFSNTVLNWKDEFQYLIALTIYECDNKYLDSTSLYIKIFSKISDIECLEILIENDIPFIRPPYDTVTKIEDWSIEEIENLRQNILKTMTVKSNSWNNTLNEVIEYIDNLKVKKASS